MKNLSYAAILGLGLGLGLATNAVQATGNDSFSDVSRGQYLTTLSDCAACHTAPGGKPFAGGLVISTPFGNLLGANITPDPETGIGNWTFDEFQRVMSRGIAPHGEHLYGAMPYTAYTKMSREDNAAIFAYLQTLEPVKNPVESNQLNFPFNFRPIVYIWDILNFRKGEFTPDESKSAEWNRGAYLVQGPGHCGACHTPKNLMGGDKTSEALRGFVVDGMLAPNITADPHRGIGNWTVQEIADYLKTGANAYDIASSGMFTEVRHSSQYWSDADLQAVAVYLKDSSDKDRTIPDPVKADDKAMQTGAAIYADRCSGCHKPQGEGIPYLFPKLAKAPLVNNDDPSSLIKVVLAGSQAGSTNARPTAPAMPSFAWNLKDREVADVVTYIRNSWGNAAPRVSPEAVRTIRKGAQPSFILRHAQGLALSMMALGGLIGLLIMVWLYKRWRRRKVKRV